MQSRTLILGRLPGQLRWRSWRAAQADVLATASILLFCLLAFYLAEQHAGVLTEQTLRKTDFVQYYGAGHLILSGHGGAIYDLRSLGGYESALQDPGGHARGVLPYLSPPYFALLISPLALLPFGAAYLAWLVVNCFLLATVMVALGRYAGLTGRSRLVWKGMIVWFAPVLLALFQGQVSISILALLTFALLALSSRRDVLGGTALALALLKPTYALPFIVLLVVAGRWRALFSFALTALVLLVAPLPILGSAVDGAYASLLVDVARWQGHAAPVIAQGMIVASTTYLIHGNHNFAGMVQAFASGPWSSVIVDTLDVVALGVLAFCGFRGRRLGAAYGLAVVTGLLLSPHVLVHDVCLLLIPAAVVLRYKPSGSWVPLLLLVGGYALVDVGFPLSFAVPIQLSVLASCALGSWLAVFSLRLRTVAVPSPPFPSAD